LMQIPRVRAYTKNLDWQNKLLNQKLLGSGQNGSLDHRPLVLAGHPILLSIN